MLVMASWERLTGPKVRSLIRMANLLENPNFNHLRIDIRSSSLAAKAYLSFLMAIPHGKYSRLLLQRLPLDPPPRPQEVALSSRSFRLLKDYEDSL
ncbi:unnamed protein product [Sphagnum balticum]